VTRATLRNVAVAAGIVAVGVGGYLGLRASSAFSVDEVQVEGGSAATQEAVAAEVRQAVGERSLLDLDADAIVAQLRALPAIQDATVDRAFPHRLDVRITPEVPVGRLPAGSRDAIVASSGRVVALVPRGRSAGLPLLAAAPAEVPAPGRRVTAPFVLDQIAVAAAARGLPGARIESLRWTDNGLVARAGGEWELRLGDADDAARKLVTGRAVLKTLSADARAELRYIDVSAPVVPVVRTDTPDAATRIASTSPIVDIAPPEGTGTESSAASDTAADTPPDGAPEPWELAGDATELVIDLFGHPQPSSGGRDATP